MKKFATLFFVSLLGGALALGGYKLIEKEEKQTEQMALTTFEIPARYSSVVPESNMDFTFAAERTLNSVVHVFTEQEMEAINNPWAEMFGFESSGPQVQRGSGSGVIIGANGYIVTNNHVIEGADRIKVNLNNNKTYAAEIIGRDPSTDIALLKIDADNLSAIDFGNSDDLQVGEWVLAVGNPFNLASTVTAGIVSAKARDIDLLQPDYYNELAPVESFIQTDAAVNPGNSGGALVNTKGELVGINTAIASMTGSYSGYSFAIPISIVQKVTKDLMDYGNVQRAFIGVQISNVNEEIAEALGMDEIEGVYVTRAIENGAAAEAGIQTDDVIVEVQNIEVSNVPKLQEVVSRYRPGDKIALKIWRDEEYRDLVLTLRNKEGNTSLFSKEENLVAKLGAEMKNLSELESRELGISGGVQIDQVKNGRIQKAGIEEGFVITHVGKDPIENIEELTERLERKQGGVLISGVYPNGEEAYYAISMK